MYINFRIKTLKRIDFLENIHKIENDMKLYLHSSYVNSEAMGIMILYIIGQLIK